MVSQPIGRRPRDSGWLVTSGRALNEPELERQPERNGQATALRWCTHRVLAPHHVGVRHPNRLAVYPTEERQSVTPDGLHVREGHEVAHIDVLPTERITAGALCEGLVGASRARRPRRETCLAVVGGGAVEGALSYAPLANVPSGPQRQQGGCQQRPPILAMDSARRTPRTGL